MIDNLSNIILKALERENDVDIFYEKKCVIIIKG